MNVFLLLHGESCLKLIKIVKNVSKIIFGDIFNEIYEIAFKKNTDGWNNIFHDLKASN